MGADLGLGSLVVAFQIKDTEADPRIQYKIYSLRQPPQLLRTITGEDYFSAADTRLDGSVEIWTTDAAAVNGFENLPRSAFDFAPTVVLRFEGKKLIDVSSEFRPYFDRQIATLRGQLDAQQLSDFKQSDGRLSGEIRRRKLRLTACSPPRSKCSKSCGATSTAAASRRPGTRSPRCGRPQTWSACAPPW